MQFYTALRALLISLCSILPLSSLSAEPSYTRVDETPHYTKPLHQELKICDLYETMAVLKAKAQTQVDAQCTCEATEEMCGKNWRGAQKRQFVCACTLPGSCEVNTCSYSDLTATARATALCKKSSCSCTVEGGSKNSQRCGEDFMKKTPVKYRCSCPQE
jgi:hypothetical protein